MANKSKDEAWVEMIRNARKVGFTVRHDHGGIAVIERGADGDQAENSGVAVAPEQPVDGKG